MSGGFQNDLLFFFLVIGALFLLWTGSGQVNKNQTNHALFVTPSSLQVSIPTVNFDPDNTATNSNNNQVSTGTSSDLSDHLNNFNSTTSPWKGKIRISSGNASSAYQSSQEYIVLQASSGNKEEINISGWVLENGLSNHYYEENDKLVTGVSRRAFIPVGSILFTNLGNDVVGPITLQPGERAIVTTGSPAPINNGFTIKNSFKVNKCTGYIERTAYYDFVPSLPTICSNPKDETGVGQLADKCYKYVTQRLGVCQTPDIKDYKLINHRSVRGSYVDGVDGFSTLCKNYLIDHFNYRGCLKYHSGDKDFFKGEWRVYLGQVWEMWASERETISLYDSQGRLVDSLKY